MARARDLIDGETERQEDFRGFTLACLVSPRQKMESCLKHLGCYLRNSS